MTTFATPSTDESELSPLVRELKRTRGVSNEFGRRIEAFVEARAVSTLVAELMLRIDNIWRVSDRDCYDIAVGLSNRSLTFGALALNYNEEAKLSNNAIAALRQSVNNWLDGRQLYELDAVEAAQFNDLLKVWLKHLDGNLRASDIYAFYEGMGVWRPALVPTVKLPTVISWCPLTLTLSGGPRFKN